MSDIAIPGDTGAVLVVDLAAIARNYRLLRERSGGAEVAASVKGDAYGLGAAQVCTALAGAGCTTFCVATAAEGRALREVLAGATILVLNGPDRDSVQTFLAHGLTPALNSLDQIDVWLAAARGAGRGARKAWLHVDTGMARLGLPAGELDALLADPARLEALRPTGVMSHLACAEDADAAKNGEQLAAFAAARARLEGVCGTLRASLANSGGVFLGPDYHFDMVRTGAALYGLRPTRAASNPMSQVVQLLGKIIQVRDVDTPMTVGYGAAHRVTGPGRIATVAIGYADGYLRAAGAGGGLEGGAAARAWIAGREVPVAGRVSMDLLTLDVTDLPAEVARPGAAVELIGAHVSPDELAEAAGTIGYEVLVRLGNRLARVYRPADAELRA